MHVIGTAGHVDHGKSALIKALTGSHPDRLAEEQERGLSIVLGFSWLTLPNGEDVGIVDVPGHRDFIENMLSGVGAIDAALFVVAADEGVMPQTREHLAILDLLRIQGGVVALNKIDLVEDPEWLDLVEEDLRDTLAGTVLEQAPIVRVSAETGAGVPDLLQTLESAITEKPERPDLGRPRISVDRVFTVSGFGTVVTGTLTDGHLAVGDDLVVLPRGVEGRVRGLQTHRHKVETAVPGSRTAVNISGVDVEEIQRGDVIAHPGDYRATRRVDVQFHLLSDATLPLEHNTEMKLFIGAAERFVRVRLLGVEQLYPGEDGWLQLEMKEPIVAIRGDRYILRRPSPSETVGGGFVVDPHPLGRHKRFDASVLDRFEALASGSPADIFLQVLHSLGVVTFDEVVKRAGLDRGVAEAALDDLLRMDAVLLLGGEQADAANTLIVSRDYWEEVTGRALQIVESYHHSYPLRQGIPREELKSRLRMPSSVFDALLQGLIAENRLEVTQLRQDVPGVTPVPVVYHPGHTVQFSSEQQEKRQNLLAEFEANPYTPPTIKDCIDQVGLEMYNALVDQGELIPVSDEVVFRREDYTEMVTAVEELLQDEGTVTVATVRDHLDSTRRYILALLEHLDAIGLTVRLGDVRKLKQ